MASFDGSFDSSFEIENIVPICVLVKDTSGNPVSTDYVVQSFINGVALADPVNVDSNGQANVYVRVDKENYIVAGYGNSAGAVFWQGEEGCITITIDPCISYEESETDKGYFFKWRTLNFCLETQLSCIKVCPDSGIELLCEEDLNPTFVDWEHDPIDEYPLPIQQGDTIKFAVKKANVGAGRLLAIVKDGVLIKKLPEATIEETSTQLWVTVPFSCILDDGEYQFAFYQDTQTLKIELEDYTPHTEGKSDGAFDVKVVGTPPYKYTIDGFETFNSTGIFTNLGAGEYKVEAIDANCNYDQRIIIMSDETFCEQFEGSTHNDLIEQEITHNDIKDCTHNDFI
jgi:hypothetical protein